MPTPQVTSQYQLHQNAPTPQVSVYLTLAALPHRFFSTKVLQRGSPAPEVNIVSGRARDFVASALILFALVVPTGIMAVVVIDEHFDGISEPFLSVVSHNHVD